MIRRPFVRTTAAIVALLILSLTVALGGAAQTTTKDDSGSMAGMNMTTSAADAAAEVAGLTRLPQPAVAPPVGERAPQTVDVQLEATEVKALMDDGVAYTYWTFNGTVPGPMIRVRQDDTVQITLKNSINSASPHSIDLHAVMGPGGGAAVTQVKPGSTAVFSFKATTPGVYVYHCATPPAPMHMANGMYGMIVVEPPQGLPHVDHEYYVMQGDYYLSGNQGDPGLHSFDMQKMVDESPNYVVFNGSVGALTGDNALKSNTGDTVRIFFGDGGPNLTSSFHVIGQIFDSVAVEGGTLVNHNVQTTLVPAGGATMVEFRTLYPGNYTLVDHSLGRATKGGMATLHVDGQPDQNIFDPIQKGDASGS